MAREQRGWRGVYRRATPGSCEVWAVRVRNDGQPDRRFRPVSCGWWTPTEAQAVLNDPGELEALAADLYYADVLEALRLLAKEGS